MSTLAQRLRDSIAIERNIWTSASEQIAAKKVTNDLLAEVEMLEGLMAIAKVEGPGPSPTAVLTANDVRAIARDVIAKVADRAYYAVTAYDAEAALSALREAAEA